MRGERLGPDGGRAGSAPPRVRGLLATWAQVTGNFWLRSRTGYALSLRNVSMHFDLARWTRMMPLLAMVIAVVVCAGAFIFSLIRPAGVVGESRIVMARESGEVFVNVDGRLYPALNLSSARLIVGAYTSPALVPQAVIDRYPVGQRVGISGAPDEMPVTNGASAVSAGVCQRSAVNSMIDRPTVTVIDGSVSLGSRAQELRSDEAIVARLGRQTYVVWGGHKSVIDPADRIVLGALGISAEQVTAPVSLSGALGNAIPPAPPLAAPVVPGAGMPSPWDLGVVAPVGAVVQADEPGSGTEFFVVLRDGVQQVASTVAAMLRSENAFGSPSPPRVSPDALARVPRVSAIAAGQYPPAPVRVVAALERPVACWVWSRGRTAASATAKVVAGTELPLAPAADAAVVDVVRSHDGPDVADAVFMAPDAANLVTVTGNRNGSATQESLWWLSRSGTRFGIAGSRSRQSLGLTVPALPMPWTLLRLFPPGLPPDVALSKEDAMTQHNSLPADSRPAALLPPS